MRSLVGILKASPSTHVENQNSFKQSLCAKSVAEQLSERISSFQGEPTLASIDVRGDYLVSMLISVLRNRILLIFGRVALVFRRHSQILCSADRTIGGPCRIVGHRNRPSNADVCTYPERIPNLHSCCSGLGFRDLLELEEYFLAVFSEIPDHFSVAQELRQIASSEYKVQMVQAIGLLGYLELARK